MVGAVTQVVAPVAPPLTAPLADTVDSTVDTVTGVVADVATSSPVTSVVAPVTDTVQDVVSTVTEKVPVVGHVVEQLPVEEILAGTVDTVTGTTQVVDGTVQTVVAGAPAPPVTEPGSDTDPVSPEAAETSELDLAPAGNATLPASSAVPSVPAGVPLRHTATALPPAGAAFLVSPPQPLVTDEPTGDVPGSPPATPGSGSSSSAGQSGGAVGAAATVVPNFAVPREDYAVPRPQADDDLPSSPVFETDTSPD
ncbi:hypothetical protein QE381_002189 [Microbacterium sp. SORGH_AS 888]|nr:hypothetical protein [Microbacterium sp. SORGH_AS_0888]